MTVAAATGLDLDTQAGDNTNGNITFEGVDGSWAVGDGSSYLVTVDADCGVGDNPDNCILLSNNPHRYKFRNFKFTNANADGVTTDDQYVYFHTYEWCIWSNNGADGLDSNNDFLDCRFVHCIFRDNTSSGLYYLNSRCHILFSLFEGNTANGALNTGNFTVFVGCLAYENGNDQYAQLRICQLMANCVGADATGGSGVTTLSGMENVTIVGCRFTGNPDHGIEQVEGSGEASNYEDYNVMYDNTNGDLQNIAGGMHSYGDDTNHIAETTSQNYIDSDTDDYNVNSGADIRSVAIDLDWDV